MKELLVVTLSILSMLGCVSRSDPRMNVNKSLETPRYTVSKVKGSCELRSYQAHLVASVSVDGDFDDASRAGFRALAGYIFGGNTSKASIAMTAPVSVAPERGEGERIAMTAPVSMSASGSGRWVVTFSMPSKYTLETLPTPKDERVKLSEQAGDQVAAIVFSGIASESNLTRHEALLRAWIKEEGLRADGPMVIARYNDPFTLPWNRRNELIIPVEVSAPQG